MTSAVVPRMPPSALVHINPFSRHAEGARILDGFRAMTMAYPVPSSDILSTNSDGAAQMLVLPNLGCSSLVLTGSVSNTTATFPFANPTPVGTDASVPAASNVALAGTALDLSTNLRAVGASYRVVGWGVVLKTLPGVSSSGRVILTKFTPRGKAPARSVDVSPYLTAAGFDTDTGTWTESQRAYQTMQAIAPAATRMSVANWLRSNGLPPLGNADTARTLEPEALRRIPGTVTASIASLGVNGLLVRGKRTSNEYLHWRGTGPWPTAAGDIAPGYVQNDQTSGLGGEGSKTFSRAFDGTYLDMTGHDGLAIVVSGAAATTSVLDFEVIYHVEVTPRADALLTTLRPPVADSATDHRAAVLAQAAHERTPHFQLVPHHFREMANGVLAGLGGQMSRLAISAAGATAGQVVGRAMSYGLEGAMGALTL